MDPICKFRFTFFTRFLQDGSLMEAFFTKESIDYQEQFNCSTLTCPVDNVYIPSPEVLGNVSYNIKFIL